MSVNREDIVNCYRYILGRNPENEDGISYAINQFKDVDSLRKNMITSEEFSNIYRMMNIDIEKRKIQEEIQEKIDEVNLISSMYCYHPKKTNSSFFLPYVMTDFIQQTIFRSDNYYEIDNLEWVFKEFMSGVIGNDVKNSVACDIGANIGNHTLYFLNELSAKKVISFEPMLKTFNILRKNVDLNNLNDHVELHNVGVSNIEGNAESQQYDYTNIGASKINVGNGNIKLVTLDSIDIPELTMMKIDVEGMELNVLQGAVKTIEKTHPYIMLEAWGESINEVSKFLSDFGYKFKKMPMGLADYIFWIE